MAITEKGWELLLTRIAEQCHAKTGRRRSIGTYQVYHHGEAQKGLSGWTAEAKGPGANRPEGNGLRIEAGRYPLATWGGQRYLTWDYSESDNPRHGPKPGLELAKTDERVEILVHPGLNFLSSIGCINLCHALPTAATRIKYADSRARVIAIIEDLKDFSPSRFPSTNGKLIPSAYVVVQGEPEF